jgi:hypothetical protein
MVALIQKLTNWKGFASAKSRISSTISVASHCVNRFSEVEPKVWNTSSSISEKFPRPRIRHPTSVFPSGNTDAVLNTSFSLESTIEEIGDQTQTSKMRIMITTRMKDPTKAIGTIKIPMTGTFSRTIAVKARMVVLEMSKAKTVALETASFLITRDFKGKWNLRSPYLRRIQNLNVRLMSVASLSTRATATKLIRKPVARTTTLCSLASSGTATKNSWRRQIYNSIIKAFIWSNETIVVTLVKVCSRKRTLWKGKHVTAHGMRVKPCW